MMQLLVSLACLALAMATSATHAANSYESNSELETAPQMINNDLIFDIGPAKLAEQNTPSYQADRIRSAMARFFVTPNGGLKELQLPDMRIRTRSAPNSPELQDISRLLSSIGADHETEARSVHEQQQASSAGAGHKSLRNIQSVFMRLPPRFGKRSIA